MASSGAPIEPGVTPRTWAELYARVRAPPSPRVFPWATYSSMDKTQESRDESRLGRGRDSGYPLPPAQNRARAPNAHGSYLGERCEAWSSSRTRAQPCVGPLFRLGVRYGLGSSAFSLVNGLPSTISFGPPWPSFDRFVGTMPLYDSPPPCMWDLSLIAFSHRSARLAGHGRQQGLSVLAREVSMHAWGLRLRRACGALALFARHSVAFRFA